VSQFKAWPKTPRLNRNCIATEKIDGTNSAVIVEILEHEGDYTNDAVAIVQAPNDVWYGVYAQSRRRLLRPGKSTDNFGFAGWVQENALELAAGLGEGYHYGEWWGSKIQRGYGLTDGEKRFSLFNVSRWHDQHDNAGDFGSEPAPKCCFVVPVLATGTIINAVAEKALTQLESEGSFAAPGFAAPEGIVIYHSAARQTFKVTCEGDDAAKGVYKGMHAQPTAEAAS
jgi:RNA ligase